MKNTPVTKEIKRKVVASVEKTLNYSKSAKKLGMNKRRVSYIFNQVCNRNLQELRVKRTRAPFVREIKLIPEKLGKGDYNISTKAKAFFNKENGPATYKTLKANLMPDEVFRQRKYARNFSFKRFRDKSVGLANSGKTWTKQDDKIVLSNPSSAALVNVLQRSIQSIIIRRHQLKTKKR